MSIKHRIRRHEQKLAPGRVGAIFLIDPELTSVQVSDTDRLRSGRRINGKVLHVISVSEAIIEDVPTVPIVDQELDTPKNPKEIGAVPHVPTVPAEEHNVRMERKTR